MITALILTAAWSLLIIMALCNAAKRGDDFASAEQQKQRYSYDSGLGGPSGARNSFSVAINRERYARLLCLRCGVVWSGDSKDLYLCDECFNEIPKTEQLVEAVPGSSLDDAAPKGLGRPEYKPLMGKPRAGHFSARQPDRVITGDTFKISVNPRRNAVPSKKARVVTPSGLAALLWIGGTFA